MPPSEHPAAYFTDRCMAVIAGNFMAPRCGLKLGHDGPHEPIKVGEQTVSESPAASLGNDQNHPNLTAAKLGAEPVKESASSAARGSDTPTGVGPRNSAATASRPRRNAVAIRRDLLPLLAAIHERILDDGELCHALEVLMILAGYLTEEASNPMGAHWHGDAPDE